MEKRKMGVTKMQIPIAKPLFGEEEKEAVAEVLESGWVVQGPRVAEFEKMIGEFTKARFTKSSSSCTTALHLALLSLGIGPGDKVLVPSFTYIASANAIEYTGATPVFIDINPYTFNIDPQKIADYLAREKTNIKGIIPVHLFGLSADMNPVIEIAKQYKLFVLEDAACALGALYHNKHTGTFGSAGCFSFHPRKSITTGEGGAIITNNEEIAIEIESLRNHGANISDLARHKKAGFLLPEFNVLGYNYRMTDIQGAIGIEQMKKLSYILTKQTERAKIYDEQLKGVEYLQLPSAPEGYKHVYQSYVTQIQNPSSNTLSLSELNEIRNRIMLRLEEKGIATRQGTHAVHILGYYRQKYHLDYDNYPASLAADRLSIALPLYAQMTDEEQGYVIDNLLQVTRECFGII